MNGILVIMVLIILLIPTVGRGKFREIERQQTMRRSMMKLQEKYRRSSL